MKIPEKVKVGGRVYTVEITENISLGSNYTGEIDYTKLVIRVRPMAQAKMEHDFIHELFHAMYDHCGYSEHTEEVADRFAAILHAIVCDNPEMFSEK